MAKMNWKECVDQGIITQITSDKERSNQMLSMANTRLSFWNRKIDEKYAALKVEAYYEIIKELIFANMYSEGYNCTNHLCLIAYLKEKIKDFDSQSEKIDELRKIRNEINYRGFTVTNDYLERNEDDFKSIVDTLKKNLKIE